MVPTQGYYGETVLAYSDFRELDLERSELRRAQSRIATNWRTWLRSHNNQIDNQLKLFRHAHKLSDKDMLERCTMHMHTNTDGSVEYAISFKFNDSEVIYNFIVLEVFSCSVTMVQGTVENIDVVNKIVVRFMDNKTFQLSDDFDIN